MDMIYQDNKQIMSMIHPGNNAASAELHEFVGLLMVKHKLTDIDILEILASYVVGRIDILRIMTKIREEMNKPDTESFV